MVDVFKHKKLFKGIAMRGLQPGIEPLILQLIYTTPYQLDHNDHQGTSGVWSTLTVLSLDGFS